MQGDVYELISLGFRYIFVALILLTIWRAFRLMNRERQAYKKTLRQLPDAGLVGELVALETGQAYPLAREGMIGSGHSCDIRLPQVRRRELEFYFQPGHGVRLIPIHHKERPSLDEEFIGRQPAFALHGTVMHLKGKPYRFRLFAGLEVPERMVPVAENQRILVEEEAPTGDWEIQGLPYLEYSSNLNKHIETPTDFLNQLTVRNEGEGPSSQTNHESQGFMIEDQTPPMPLSLEQAQLPAEATEPSASNIQSSWADMTWQYAPFPDPASQKEDEIRRPRRRNRRANRSETSRDTDR